MGNATGTVARCHFDLATSTPRGIRIPKAAPTRATKPEALAELSKYPWRWDTQVVSIGAAGSSYSTKMLVSGGGQALVSGAPEDVCRDCGEGIFEPRPVSTFIRQFERALSIEWTCSGVDPVSMILNRHWTPVQSSLPPIVQELF
jgi:hypothetical protein